jgi:hypothetical protein
MKHKQAMKCKCEAAVMDAIHDDELFITYDFISKYQQWHQDAKLCQKAKTDDQYSVKHFWQTCHIILQETQTSTKNTAETSPDY